jgi:aminopeptidase YwaD
MTESLPPKVRSQTLMNRPFSKRFVLIPLVLILVSAWLTVAVMRSSRTPAANSGSAISDTEFFQHVKYLASDELTGRLAGGPGAEKAAEYIARQFEQNGLTTKAGQHSYHQVFSFVSGMELGPKNQLTVTAGTDQSALALHKDFLPTAFSLSGDFEAEAVFGGYGISAASLNYDDYEGLDAKDHFVFVLRYGPEGNNQHSQFNRYHALRYKALTAREKGAKGIVFIDDQEDFSKSTLSKLRYDADFSDSGIPALAVSLPVARDLFRKAELDLDALQKEIAASKKPRSTKLRGLRLSFHSELRKVTKSTANVVGVLEGNDPRLKEEAIVIGAHYDHLGLGDLGSLSEGRGKEIHNGADDNASGTAGLLELARVLAARRSELKRTLAFVAFSAEEAGLLGSKYYVANPAVPLDKTVAMINMDMIGRMKGNRVILGGSGSSPLWKELLTRQNQHSQLELKFDDDGFGPSDHASFYSKDVPVLFFFTGVHQDYHRPSDDYDKINQAGAQKVVELVYETVLNISQQETRPLFTKAKESPGSRGRSEFRVYLGTIPDYGEEVEGVKLSGVREGSPAAKAGLRSGDVIVECGGKQIKNVYDYTYILGERKAGELLEIVVLRDNERVKLQATLEQRP